MLNNREKQFYARHLSLEEIGLLGQEKLKAARVLVVGAGGLGCPVLQYLTAAGVGTIGIVDNDHVDISNLQRQILFSIDDVGKPKVEMAVGKLRALNPEVEFIGYKTRLTNRNALELFRKFDFIIDGSDNFPTRYLVNDACVILKLPFVFGSIFKFEGQVAVFNYKNGPSYRCLYPSPPKAGEVPNCSEIGVLGVLPGVIGTRMATECLKMILNTGEILSGKLLVNDLLSNQSMTLNITRDDANFNRSELESSYEDFCGVNISKPEKTITSKELKSWMESGKAFSIVDVREEFEWEICRIDSSTHIPLGELTSKHNLIPKDRPVIMLCHHGSRSALAIRELENENFTNLINLEGGIHAWAKEIDPKMITY